MHPRSCALIGAPIQTGASQPGCIMGPDAYRTAGLFETLTELGHDVTDHGNVAVELTAPVDHPNTAVHHLGDTVAWGEALGKAALKAAKSSDMPIFLGGDHSMAIGTVPAMARHAKTRNRKQFVLWLDAHPDMHTLSTTKSGNLHGTPVAYFTGMPGFEGLYPALETAVDPKNVCMLGIRSVDQAERDALTTSGVDIHDMRAIDEAGIAAPLRAFLARVIDEDGDLHVSLDVDFLDPSIAPAVGTTVPGGATFREAHLVMEMLCDTRRVTSLDLVELNPFLDERGRTARLMVDLCASLMGRKVLDRMTTRY